MNNEVEMIGTDIVNLTEQKPQNGGLLDASTAEACDCYTAYDKWEWRGVKEADE